MNALPFDRPGQFYRGNLHTHSTNSDGALSPDDVIASYRAAGYDFLALTDHFLDRYGFPITDTREHRDERFTTILGAELHTGAIEIGERWHILAVGLPLDFAPTAPNETPAQLCARAKAAGAFVAAAHPAWYGVTPADVISLGEIDAVETYNQTCAAHNDRGDSWQTLDMLLAQGRRYLAVATDDAHFHGYRRDWQCAWVQVKATHLEPNAILDALKAGHHYLSTGPELYDVRLDGRDRVTVVCSPCAAIFAAGRGAQARMIQGSDLREATLSLDGLNTPYFRVTVVDRHGRHAWTNPIWRE